MTANRYVREKIINDFAEWTAFSATRSGCPVKSRYVVYPLIRTPKYQSVLSGKEIQTAEFDDWHQESTLAICGAEPAFPVGWAAKLINIYLKTTGYLAGMGRPSLVQCIHPPIDNGLWEGIRAEYGHRPDITLKTHVVNRIKDIDNYDKYKTIIYGCRLIAKDRGCYLIEVEELWQGTKIREALTMPCSESDIKRPLDDDRVISKKEYKHETQGIRSNHKYNKGRKTN